MTYIAFFGEVIVRFKLVSLSLLCSSRSSSFFFYGWFIWSISFFFPYRSLSCLIFLLEGCFRWAFCQSFTVESDSDSVTLVFLVYVCLLIWLTQQYLHICCFSTDLLAVHVYQSIFKYNISADISVCLSKDHLSPSVWLKTIWYSSWFPLSHHLFPPPCFLPSYLCSSLRSHWV